MSDSKEEEDSRDKVLKAAFCCRTSLVAYAYSFTTDHAAAEDIVQNSFLVVARKHAQFEEGTSMLSWCRSIVRLEVQNYLRKHRRQQPVEQRILLDAVDAAFDAHQSAGLETKLDFLRTCLGKLPNRGRDLIRLRYEDESNYTAIANELGMKLEAVRKALFRTKQQLRQCVAEQIALSRHEP